MEEPGAESQYEGEGILNNPRPNRVSPGGQIYSDVGIWDKLTSGWWYVSQYGWFVLLGVIIILYLWNKYKSTYYQWKRKREEWQEEQNFDGVKAERYQDAMMRAREKMQHSLDEQTAIYQTKVEERQEKERDEKIKQWEEFKVITRSKPKQTSKTYSRRDYLPMGGGGGGGGYRPPRRQLGGGGGG